MASKIVTILSAAAMLLSASAAQATMCYWVGNYYHCSDDYGNTTTCYRVGNYTYCN